LDMPRAVGFSVLDTSKLLMLRWHYLWFKALFGVNAILLFTDTDSLAYKIFCKNIMREMMACKFNIFDLLEGISPEDLLRHCNGNLQDAAKLLLHLKDVKGTLGAMKLENQTHAIREYVGLASKMYSLSMMGHVDFEGDDKKDGICIDYMKGKGVPKRVLQKKATHETYKDMIFNTSVNRITFRTLRSKNHVVEQLEIDRKMLTAYNDKVYQIDSLSSRPLGHWRNTFIGPMPLDQTR
jgi:hypothetical protein